MNLPRFLIPGLFAAASAAFAAEQASVVVTHELSVARPAETITVPWADVVRVLPGAIPQNLAVRDAAGESLPYQVIAGGSETGKSSETGAPATLIFQHDFAAGEKSATFTVMKTAEPAPAFPSRVFARYIAERLDDFAWENDKIAHRTYGPALATPAAGSEQLVTSGVDVWCKRVSRLVVDHWYAVNNYHHDAGEGLDMYHVGKSRGCGGTGIWVGNTLYPGRNYQGWKVLANGPIRAIFELSYDAWEAPGMKVTETKRFTVDAGHNLDQVESTFTVVEGVAKEVTVAIGVTKNSSDTGEDTHAQPTRNQAGGWFAQWEKEAAYGEIGEAVIVPGAALQGFAEDSTNQLLLANATSGQPLLYYIGAGWSRAGEFTNQQAWIDYVATWAARLRSPIHVSIAAAAGSAASAGVIDVMERIADWQLAHPSNWGSTEWQNGAFYAGAMALARASTSPRFHDAMRKMGEANHWQPGPRPYHADDQVVGQTYAELYLHDRNPAEIAPLQERFDFVLAHRKDGSLEFDGKRNPGNQDRWSWCDALFMAPPAWIRLWSATGRAAYLDFAVAEWGATSDYLYDREEHLYFRDSSYFNRREKNGRKIFWSRGNGWVMGGLVRMLQFLPVDHPARLRFVQQFREMSGAILACQQSDGFWRASLLDPASYPMQETSGTGFYCYALAWGVNEGVLDRAQFAPAVRRAWTALVSCVSPEGKLTHVQPIGATPVTFDAESTEPYGVGSFLLAGSEVRRLDLPAAKL